MKWRQSPLLRRKAFEINREQQLSLDCRAGALAMACEHHFDSGEVAAGDPSIELYRQMSDRLWHAFGASRHRVSPEHGPIPFSHRRSASAAENEERILGVEQFLGGVEYAFVEITDKAMFSGKEDEGPT